jgi:hypothetical protein
LKRQERLQTEDEIGEKQAYRTEQQHRERVMLPILFCPGIDTGKLINQILNGFEDGIEEGSAVCVEHLAKINAQGLGNRQQDADKERKLDPV